MNVTPLAYSVALTVGSGAFLNSGTINLPGTLTQSLIPATALIGNASTTAAIGGGVLIGSGLTLQPGSTAYPGGTLLATGGGGGSLTFENAGTVIGTATTLNAGAGITATVTSGVATLSASLGGALGISRPSLSSLTQFNWGTIVTANDIAGGPLSMTVTTAGLTVAGLGLAGTISAPWALTIGMDAPVMNAGNQGLFVVDTAGKAQTLQQATTSLLWQNWNSTTSYATNAVTMSYSPYPARSGLRITNNGTTYSFYTSINGVDWKLTGTAAATAWLNGTIASVGFYACYNNPMITSVYYFDYEAGTGTNTLWTW